MKQWAIITGAGTGIGAALAKELSNYNIHILAIGRRLQPLLDTQKHAPGMIHTLAVDISTEEGRQKIFDAIPADHSVKYLVQNAAVGVPSRLGDVRSVDFNYAMAVNVTAPLFLTKGFFSQLKASEGRILHVTTGVARMPQVGTITYGVTKMAFDRLYDQLKVELQGSGVTIASVLPGVVDTEGLWEHIKLAKEHRLPHVSYFDKVQRDGKMVSAEFCAKFLKFILMDTSSDEYSQVWNIHDEFHAARWT